jgi:hypothetical protein
MPELSSHCGKRKLTRAFDLNHRHVSFSLVGPAHVSRNGECTAVDKAKRTKPAPFTSSPPQKKTARTLSAGVLVDQTTEPSMVPLLARQRPAVVSHTGRSEGQQCSWSSQQVAEGSGQHAQVKQKPKNSRMQQQVLPVGHIDGRS